MAKSLAQRRGQRHEDATGAVKNAYNGSVKTKFLTTRVSSAGDKTMNVMF